MRRVLSVLKEKRCSELSMMACGGAARCYDAAVLKCIRRDID